MKYVLGSNSITVFAAGKPHTVNRNAKIFQAILNAVQADDEGRFLQVVNTKEDFAKKSNGLVTVENGSLMYGDRPITGLVSTRIFEMLELGLSIQPMINFIENVMKNPSKRAVDELFDFISACDLPITEDGHFLAYKKVKEDYMDCYSGTIRNKIGDTPSMPRNMVDEDKNRTCSSGLHFCSHEYLKSFGGERVMILKINPKDVVAIPADYNNSKGRCSTYEVVGEIEAERGMPKENLDSNYAVKNQHIKIAEKPKQSNAVKMTFELADQLREDWSVGYTKSELMEAYNLSRRQVKQILNNEAWVTI